MIRRPIDDRGFTLIEVLIALAVLSVALIALAGMFPTGYRQVVDAGRMTVAVSTARQILEDVRLVPFANLPNFGPNWSSANAAPPGNPENAFAVRWQQALATFGGTATLAVAGPPWGGSNQLVQVTATVTVPALQQSVVISTVIASMQ